MLFFAEEDIIVKAKHGRAFPTWQTQTGSSFV